MPKVDSSFPYFMPVQKRSLTEVEARTVARMAASLSSSYANQLTGLHVVGRCGCGGCPTIFFQAHVAGEPEVEVAMFSGHDHFGGLVGVTLFAKAGKLSQLEYFSLDGHEPWAPPEPSNLQLQG